jgi:hypothetical protein
MGASAGSEVGLMAKVQQRVKSDVYCHHHAAAVAAVTAGRAAAWHEPLAPEGNYAIAASAAADVYSGFVEE